MRWTPAQQRFYRRQVAELARATRQYGEDERRSVLKRLTGKASTADLSKEQMKRVIDFQERILRQCDPNHVRIRRTHSRPDVSMRNVSALGDAMQAVVRRLEAGEPASERPKRDPGKPWTQDYYIAFLASELGWSGTPERLRGFVQRETRGWTDDPTRLNRAQKSQLIAGMRKLLAAQRAGIARAERSPSDHPRANWTPQVISK